MKFPEILCSCLLLISCTGCSSEPIADRVYTQSVGLTCDGTLSFYMQDFNETTISPVKGESIAEVLRQAETVTGGKIFIGHTELLCLDGTCTFNPAEELLFEKGLSPACKILYTQPETYFQNPDSKSVIHMIRISEQNGLLSSTELSSALEEWHGIGKTALLPVQKDNQLSLVFLHQDGHCTALSDNAVKGIYWLRRNSGNFLLTLNTPDGEKNISVKKCQLEKNFSSQEFFYHVIVWADSPQYHTLLKEQIENQCQTAIAEMRSAGADVIGLQDLLESENFRPEDHISAPIHLTVTIQ